ncbi:thiosulfate oxidation carrier complex protein SoxZ [Neomegalonema sp.]|uniref:thiosulfate oxidation carrier complex protein SoxZ n=1 Tax=Neomegalonema sp. TaxID=2039713 RepID=UPI002612BF6F|nr:thiosulfate oxidation carrier complex protein SoxZ [Neomegalonema sp.]MDD2867348.1 thiosulfate oxidation carrier complex protein SoxZ [Neomegalonema sp.]
MSRPPRLWISSATPAKGEIIRVRVQIQHVMESGFRLDWNGAPLERNLLTRFEARLNETLLMEWEPGASISQNPYVEFAFAARESGTLRMLWLDDRGMRLEAEREIILSPA